MLVLDPQTGRYNAAATPSTGSETLFDFYARLIDGEASAERGDHAVFQAAAGTWPRWLTPTAMSMSR